MLYYLGFEPLLVVKRSKELAIDLSNACDILAWKICIKKLYGSFPVKKLAKNISNPFNKEGRCVNLMPMRV